MAYFAAFKAPGEEVNTRFGIEINSKDSEIIVGHFTGYNDSIAANSANEILLNQFKQKNEKQNLKSALRSAFRGTQTEMRERWKNSWPKDKSGHGNPTGTTATLAVVRGNEVVLGHLGETAAFLISNDGQFMRLTPEHSTSIETERTRINRISENIMEDKIMTTREKVFRQKTICWDTGKCPCDHADHKPQKLPLSRSTKGLGAFNIFDTIQRKEIISSYPSICTPKTNLNSNCRHFIVFCSKDVADIADQKMFSCIFDETLTNPAENVLYNAMRKIEVNKHSKEVRSVMIENFSVLLVSINALKNLSFFKTKLTLRKSTTNSSIVISTEERSSKKVKQIRLDGTAYQAFKTEYGNDNVPEPKTKSTKITAQWETFFLHKLQANEIGISCANQTSPCANDPVPGTSSSFNRTRVATQNLEITNDQVKPIEKKKRQSSKKKQMSNRSPEKNQSVDAPAPRRSGRSRKVVNYAENDHRLKSKIINPSTPEIVQPRMTRKRASARKQPTEKVKEKFQQNARIERQNVNLNATNESPETSKTPEPAPEADEVVLEAACPTSPVIAMTSNLTLQVQSSSTNDNSILPAVNPPTENHNASPTLVETQNQPQRKKKSRRSPNSERIVMSKADMEAGIDYVARKSEREPEIQYPPDEPRFIYKGSASAMSQFIKPCMFENEVQPRAMFIVPTSMVKNFQRVAEKANQNLGYNQCKSGVIHIASSYNDFIIGAAAKRTVIAGVTAEAETSRDRTENPPGVSYATLETVEAIVTQAVTTPSQAAENQPSLPPTTPNNSTNQEGQTDTIATRKRNLHDENNLLQNGNNQDSPPVVPKKKFIMEQSNAEVGTAQAEATPADEAPAQPGVENINSQIPEGNLNDHAPVGPEHGQPEPMDCCNSEPPRQIEGEVPQGQESGSTATVTFSAAGEPGNNVATQVNSQSSLPSQPLPALAVPQGNSNDQEPEPMDCGVTISETVDQAPVLEPQVSADPNLSHGIYSTFTSSENQFYIPPMSILTSAQPIYTFASPASAQATRASHGEINTGASSSSIFDQLQEPGTFTPEQTPNPPLTNLTATAQTEPFTMEPLPVMVTQNFQLPTTPVANPSSAICVPPPNPSIPPISTEGNFPLQATTMATAPYQPFRWQAESMATIMNNTNMDLTTSEIPMAPATAPIVDFGPQILVPQSVNVTDRELQEFNFENNGSQYWTDDTVFGLGVQQAQAHHETPIQVGGVGATLNAIGNSAGLGLANFEPLEEHFPNNETTSGGLSHRQDSVAVPNPEAVNMDLSEIPDLDFLDDFSLSPEPEVSSRVTENIASHEHVNPEQPEMGENIFPPPKQPRLDTIPANHNGPPNILPHIDIPFRMEHGLSMNDPPFEVLEAREEMSAEQRQALDNRIDENLWMTTRMPRTHRFTSGTCSVLNEHRIITPRYQPEGINAPYWMAPIPAVKVKYLPNIQLKTPQLKNPMSVQKGPPPEKSQSLTSNNMTNSVSRWCEEELSTSEWKNNENRDENDVVDLTDSDEDDETEAEPKKQQNQVAPVPSTSLLPATTTTSTQETSGPSKDTAEPTSSSVRSATNVTPAPASPSTQSKQSASMACVPLLSKTAPPWTLPGTARPGTFPSQGRPPATIEMTEYFEVPGTNKIFKASMKHQHIIDNRRGIALYSLQAALVATNRTRKNTSGTTRTNNKTAKHTSTSTPTVLTPAVHSNLSMPDLSPAVQETSSATPVKRSTPAPIRPPVRPPATSIEQAATFVIETPQQNQGPTNSLTTDEERTEAESTPPTTGPSPPPTVATQAANGETPPATASNPPTPVRSPAGTPPVTVTPPLPSPTPSVSQADPFVFAKPYPVKRVVKSATKTLSAVVSTPNEVPKTKLVSSTPILPSQKMGLFRPMQSLNMTASTSRVSVTHNAATSTQQTVLKVPPATTSVPSTPNVPKAPATVAKPVTAESAVQPQTDTGLATTICQTTSTTSSKPTASQKVVPSVTSAISEKSPSVSSTPTNATKTATLNPPLMPSASSVSTTNPTLTPKPIVAPSKAYKIPKSVEDAKTSNKSVATSEKPISENVVTKKKPGEPREQ